MGACTNFSPLDLRELLQTCLNWLVFKSSQQSTGTKHSNHQKRTNRTLAASTRGWRWRVGLGLKVTESTFLMLFCIAFPHLLPVSQTELRIGIQTRPTLACFASAFSSAWNSFLISLLLKTHISWKHTMNT